MKIILMLIIINSAVCYFLLFLKHEFEFELRTVRHSTSRKKEKNILSLIECFLYTATNDWKIFVNKFSREKKRRQIFLFYKNEILKSNLVNITIIHLLVSFVTIHTMKTFVVIFLNKPTSRGGLLWSSIALCLSNWRMREREKSFFDQTYQMIV